MGCASSASVAASDGHAPVLEKGFFDCYALGVKLGRGAFGQVRIATPLTSKNNFRAAEDFAVKILDLRDKEEPGTLSKTLQKSATSEACLWLQVKSHANVVHLQDVFYDDVFCYYVMEKCTSSLFAHLESIAELNERSVGNLLSQMLLGVEHVHSAGVVHRDVKPDNFLMGGADGATVKLCDFGLSAALPSDGQLKGVYGTAPFMCPEMIKGKEYNANADVWSMGVLAYALLFGTFPYLPKVPNSRAMKQAIVDGKPPTYHPVAPCVEQKRSNSAILFVKTLLERAADQRPSASDALKMPYLVAVRENRHMYGTELPSLRPMVYTAKKAGAFELRDISKEADIDPLLNEKQQRSNGMSLPVQTSEKKILEKTSGCGLKEKAKSGEFQLAKSNVSLNSKVWDNTSSFATTASASSSLRGTAVPSDCSSPKRLISDSSSGSLAARTDPGLNTTLDV